MPANSSLLTPGYRRADRRDSAAVSIAANRLSKVRLLLADGSPRCDRIAVRFARTLAGDIAAHLEYYPSTSEGAAWRLREIAATALDEVEAGR